MIDRCTFLVVGIASLWSWGVSAEGINISAPYDYQGGMYTVKGTRQFDVIFSNEPLSECTGNGCSDGGTPSGADGGGDGGGPPLPQPGVERVEPGGRALSGMIFAPIAGVFNSQMSNLFGGRRSGDGGRLAAQMRANDWLVNQSGAKEAEAQKQIREYWARGHFFSEKQFGATEKSLEDLANKIRGRTFDQQDVASLVLHAPAADEQVRNAVSQQVASATNAYQSIANQCCPDCAACSFTFDGRSYVSNYVELAKKAEAPNFERYAKMVEAKVDAITEAVIEHYNEHSTNLSSRAPTNGSVEIRGGLLRKLADLKTKLQANQPQTETAKRGREAGLRAVSIGSKALRENDLATAKMSVLVAESMLDVAIGATPLIGLARDVYEFVTGKNLLNGENLSDDERLLAAIGVLTAGLTDESQALNRSARRFQDSEVLNKEMSKVRTFESDAVNEFLMKKHGWKEAPYRTNTRVYRYETIQTETYVRVFVEGKSEKNGAWLMRPRDIEGLSPDQIKSKFALPQRPTHFTEVTVPAGTVMERGAVNKGIFEGDKNVAYQYRIPDSSKTTYSDGRALPDKGHSENETPDVH